jgi:ABC-type Fe3+-citrate transport system substrate-binding protein
MNRNLTLYIAGILLTLAAVAGCASIDGNSTSDRSNAQVRSEPNRTRAAGRSNEPPNITYRPGA